MSYQSLTFIMFCAAALILYYVVGAGRRRQLCVLALANLAFYIIAGVKYLPFILVTTVATYVAGRAMGAVYDKADLKLSETEDPAEKKEIRNGAKKRAKVYLILSLVVAVGLLAVCKYTLFTVNNINALCSLMGVPQISTFSMILPIGISFYTFMALSYVLDIYWKRYKAEKSFLTYAVYLSYFPHVVQGPIDRFNEFRDQIKDGVKLSYNNITYGAQLTVWGFFKKLVIADRLGIFINEVIDNHGDYDGAMLIVAFLLYSIQIYTDFSGCIDIVSGISEMFGIKLRKNFNHPYFSKTMGEFWRRWHISLQEWFKDYIYFPVSASAFIKKIKKKLKAKGKKRAEELFGSCLPVLVVWLVTGIWHGAAWKFVTWGLYHAALLIGSQLLEPLFAKVNKALKIDTENFGWKLWQMVRTFLLCTIGRVFFRADGIADAFNIFRKMICETNFATLFGYDFTTFGYAQNEVPLIHFVLLVLLVVSALQEKIHIRETLSKQNIVLRWVVIFAGLFAVIIFGIYGPGYDAAAFIYEQF